MEEKQIERAWINATTQELEKWKTVTHDRASRELANAHGDNALKKLFEAGTLTTRFATYRVVK